MPRHRALGVAVPAAVLVRVTQAERRLVSRIDGGGAAHCLAHIRPIRKREMGIRIVPKAEIGTDRFQRFLTQIRHAYGS